MSTPETGTTDACAICDQPARLTLYASRIAPVSYPVCQRCDARGAEALGIVLMWTFLQGGPTRTPDMASQLVSYDGQTYVTWDRISALYRWNQFDIAKSTLEEFGLPPNFRP